MHLPCNHYMMFSFLILLNAPKQQIWAMLLDPETLTKVIPSLKSLEAAESGIYKAILEVKMGLVVEIAQPFQASKIKDFDVSLVYFYELFAF